ncbi:hypothetical protein P692DRAFT_20819155 [Suillus brevipes Sb2]|nr:hypothetical protein P692DRAFT_20819155 [Suillus brevipes Sb2]
MDRVGDWTIEQVEWLDGQTESYLAATQDDDLSFFSTVCEQFLSLWPVRQTLWPSKPEYQHLTKPELRCVYRGEDRLKSRIRAFFEDRHPQAGAGVLAVRIGVWSNDQLEWLKARVSPYLTARRNDELHIFRPSLFETFFRLWPVRRFLWPTKPVWQILTRAERRCVSDGEREFAVDIVQSRGLRDEIFRQLHALCEHSTNVPLSQ